MSLRFAALGLIAQQPGSGYDLLGRFEKSMANVWAATQSQLYGELNKLAEAGLIEVTEVGARGRKEYGVTDAGRAELLRWITDPGETPIRRPDLLRIFLLNEIPADEARKHVLTFAEHADSELTRLGNLRDAWHPDGTDPADFFGRAALEYGLRNAAMEAHWARWLLATMDERESSTR